MKSSSIPPKSHVHASDKSRNEKDDLCADDPLSHLPPGYTYPTLHEHSIERYVQDRTGLLNYRKLEAMAILYSDLDLEVYPVTFATRPFTSSIISSEAMLAIYRSPPPSPLKQTSRFKVGKKASPELIQQQGLIEYKTGILRRLIHVPACYENVKKTLKEWVAAAPEPERFTREQACIVIKNVCKTLDPSLFLDEEFKDRVMARLPKDIDGNPKAWLTSLPDCLSELTWVKTLSVSGHNIKKLPPLPPYLSALEASYNEEIKIGVLPETLELLSVRHAKVGKLPRLPDGLRYLDATFCRLTELPKLPSQLNTLILEENDLRALPEVLPTRLAKLDIRRNRNLTKLSELPYTLVYLNMRRTPIEKLPMTFKTDKMWTFVGSTRGMDYDSYFRMSKAPKDPWVPIPISEDQGMNNLPGQFNRAGGFIHTYKTIRK